MQFGAHELRWLGAGVMADALVHLFLSCVRYLRFKSAMRREVEAEMRAFRREGNSILN